MREDIEIHMKNSKINPKSVADYDIDWMVSIVIQCDRNIYGKKHQTNMSFCSINVTFNVVFYVKHKI